MRTQYKCGKCQYQWFSKVAAPKACAQCRSRDWETIYIKETELPKDEIWLPIEGTEKLYFVSMSGKLFSMRTGRYLHPNNMHQVLITLPDGTKKNINFGKVMLKTFKPHEEVARSFIFINQSFKYNLENLAWKR